MSPERFASPSGATPCTEADGHILEAGKRTHLRTGTFGSGQVVGPVRSYFGLFLRRHAPHDSCRTGHRGNGCRTNRPTNKPQRLLRNMELRDRGKSVSRAREATCSGMRIVLRHSAGIRSARIFRDPRAQSSESATVTRILSIRRPSIASTRRVSRRYASVSPRRRKSFLISSISPASVSASPFASSR